MDNFLITLLLFGGAQSHSRDIIKRTLPVTLPGSAGQRFALAAVLAGRELKLQEQEEKQIIQEVVDKTHIQDGAALEQQFPALHAVFVRLPPAVQTSIVFSGSGDGDQVVPESRERRA
jgi:hypothetical protein